MQTALWVTLTAFFAIAQYALAVQSLRDLVRRRRVRGGNKMTWALVILCLPIIGPLFYSWNGPTSFRNASPVHRHQPTGDALLDYIEREVPEPPANVTPLRPGGTISARTPAERRGLTRSRAHNVAARSRPMRHLGS